MVIFRLEVFWLRNLGTIFENLKVKIRPKMIFNFDKKVSKNKDLKIFLIFIYFLQEKKYFFSPGSIVGAVYFVISETKNRTK